MRKNCITLVITALLAFGIVKSALPSVETNAANFIDTQTQDSNLAMAPALITELTNSAQLEEYAAAASSVRPSNVILNLNADGDVIDATGNTISSIANVYETLSNLNVLTIVRLDDEQAVDAVDYWLGDNSAVYDVAVLSDDISLIRDIKSAYLYIRAIADYSATKVTENNRYDLLKEANVAGCNVMMLSLENAMTEHVTYLQSRFKAVWVTAEKEDKFHFLSCVSTGAYGIIIPDDPATYYAYYNEYQTNSLSREYLNIAHRGWYRNYPENTLEGCLAAYNEGADAIEIDLKVSADNQLFLFHNSNLAEITDGNGRAEDKTMQELSQINVVKEDLSYPIPSLDNIFTAFKALDCLIVCEIKTSIDSFATLFKQKVQEYDMYDKVVVICFESYYPGQLQKMKDVAPEIPTSCLTEAAMSAETNKDLFKFVATTNSTIDANSNTTTADWETNLKSRGYLPFAWTYNQLPSCKSAIQYGIVGITNNDPNAFGILQKRIELKDGGYSVQSVEDLATATFPINLVKGDRSKTETEAKVFSYQVCEDGKSVDVILKHTANGYTIYSPAVNVKIKSSTKKSGGCGSSLCESFPIVGVAIALATLLSKRKKKA